MTYEERNAQISKDYKAGASVYDLSQKYQLSRWWIYKVIRKENVALRPPSERPKGERNTFLGANIAEQTKKDVEALAYEKSTSVSALTDQALKELIKKEKSA